MQSLVPGRDFRISLNSGSHKKKFAGVFVTVSDDFLLLFFFGGELFGKKCLCYPRSGDVGSILA